MPDWDQIAKEFKISTSRSGGSGGQHVNKVETKVRLCFSIQDSIGLSADEKDLLLLNYQKRIDSNKRLCISVQRSRSQLGNKEEAIFQMKKLIEKGLIPPKKRKRTNIPASEKEKRLENKKVRSWLKKLRKNPEY